MTPFLRGTNEATMTAIKTTPGVPTCWSLVFTPVRVAVEAASHAEAVAASARVTGSGVSQQAYALAPKILEVERWLPASRCPVFEAHPEVSFAVLLGAEASASKRTWAGMVERRDGLAGVGIHLDDIDAEVGRVVAVDDVLDAAVVAWSAQRLAAGAARCFPAPPVLGATGRPIAISA